MSVKKLCSDGSYMFDILRACFWYSPPPSVAYERIYRCQTGRQAGRQDLVVWYRIEICNIGGCYDILTNWSLYPLYGICLIWMFEWLWAFNSIIMFFNFCFIFLKGWFAQKTQCIFFWVMHVFPDTQTL